MISILTVISLAVTDPFAMRDTRVLDARKLHLGNNTDKRFGDVSETAQGERFETDFDAKANSSEQVLLLYQRDVSDAWRVEINGRVIGSLAREAAAFTLRLRVPPGTLIDGKNHLVVRPEKVNDDIIVGDVQLDSRSLKEMLQLETVAIRVTDKAGKPIPARVDIVRTSGARTKPQLYDFAARLAARNGVVYSGDGAIDVAIEPGTYEVFATRGMEWGVAKASFELDGVGDSKLVLAIDREVDTTGYVAADTHVHTLTYSGHGDSSVEERMVTLAGEGVELAVATDHNHHTDYRPIETSMHLDAEFTPVIGNEVTTDIGHFTAFPFAANSPVPNWKLGDYVKLVAEMRDKGAKVVFLNHPRWPSYDAFKVFELDPFTGMMGSKAPQFTFDGIEVVNTNTPTIDGPTVLRDWFGLLNAGHRLFAVASSDSHTVASPVGLGRTYVLSKTDDPSRIDIDECCANYHAGRFSAALGIFVTYTVNGEPSSSTIATHGAPLHVVAQVRYASWIPCKRLVAYVDGAEVARQEFDGYVGRQGRELTFDIPAPRHDGWVTVVAEGDDAPYDFWPTGEKYTLGVAQPVFLDADADGRVATLMEIAKLALAKASSWKDAIANVDDGAAIQVLALVLADAPSGVEREIATFGESGAGGRALLASFLKSRFASRKW